MRARLEPVTLLSLEILIYFSQLYKWVVFYSTLILYIYKSYAFTYPDNVIGWEITFTVCYVIIEYVRLFLASRGNKAEMMSPLLMSVALAIPQIVYSAYQISLQTYVLRLEQIIQAISLVFVSGSALLQFLLIFRLSMKAEA